jgi:hypothetical protein
MLELLFDTHKVYTSLEHIQGTVKYTVGSPKVVKSINVVIRGRTHVGISLPSELAGYGSLQQHETHTFLYDRQKLLVFDDTSKKGFTIAQGVQLFNFDFQFPYTSECENEKHPHTVLPPSVETTAVGLDTFAVEYDVKVEVLKVGRLGVQQKNSVSKQIQFRPLEDINPRYYEVLHLSPCRILHLMLRCFSILEILTQTESLSV